MTKTRWKALCNEQAIAWKDEIETLSHKAPSGVWRGDDLKAIMFLNSIREYLTRIIQLTNKCPSHSKTS